MSARQLILLGGGGFSMEASPLLDRYFLAAAGKPSPKICFIGTASGDAADYQLKFFRSHAAYSCQASQLSLFRPHTRDIAGFLLEQDAIFVGGGNTRSMLALWREWGVDKALHQAYVAGTVLGGISAGMICWFEAGLTDSNGGALDALPCLGWLPGGACPHYDGEAERRPSLLAQVGSGTMPASWAADDSVALHFIDETLHAAVSSRPNARAWRVTAEPGHPAIETALQPRYLG